MVLIPCLSCHRVTTRVKGHLGRCPECYRRHSRERERRRPPRAKSTAARGYGSRHQRLAKEAIARQPWCTQCGHPGSADNPLTAEHLTPIVLGGQAEVGNYTVLCAKHNSAGGGRLAHRGEAQGDA